MVGGVLADKRLFALCVVHGGQELVLQHLLDGEPVLFVLLETSVNEVLEVF